MIPRVKMIQFQLPDGCNWIDSIQSDLVLFRFDNGWSSNCADTVNMVLSNQYESHPQLSLSSSSSTQSLTPPLTLHLKTINHNDHTKKFVFDVWLLQNATWFLPHLQSFIGFTTVYGGENIAMTRVCKAFDYYFSQCTTRIYIPIQYKPLHVDYRPNQSELVFIYQQLVGSWTTNLLKMIKKCPKATFEIEYPPTLMQLCMNYTACQVDTSNHEAFSKRLYMLFFMPIHQQLAPIANRVTKICIREIDMEESRFLSSVIDEKQPRKGFIDALLTHFLEDYPSLLALDYMLHKQEMLLENDFTIVTEPLAARLYEEHVRTRNTWNKKKELHPNEDLPEPVSRKFQFRFNNQPMIQVETKGVFCERFQTGMTCARCDRDLIYHSDQLDSGMDLNRCSIPPPLESIDIYQPVDILFTGLINDTLCSVQCCRSDDLVTLHFSPLTAQMTNAGTLVITNTSNPLPAFFRPKNQEVRLNFCTYAENQREQGKCSQIVITTAGVITIYCGTSNWTFTHGVKCGWNCSYSIMYLGM